MRRPGPGQTTGLNQGGYPPDLDWQEQESELELRGDVGTRYHDREWAMEAKLAFEAGRDLVVHMGLSPDGEGAST